MPSPRPVAVALTGTNATLLVAGAALLPALPPGSGRTWALFAALGLLGAGTAVLSLVVARRVPGNPVGALLAWVGLCISFLTARDVYYAVLAAPGPPDAEPLVVAALNESAWWLFVAVALLLLYFPTGRLPSRRWRWVPPALVCSAVVTHLYGAVDPAPYLPPFEQLRHPFGRPSPVVDAVAIAVFVALLVLILAAAGSYGLRLRRATGVLRAQLSWPLLPGLAFALYPLSCLAEVLLIGHTWWVSTVVLGAALAGLPVAITVALLRHDLYDVDKALAAAVTYLAVSLVLVGVFASTSLLVGLAVGGESSLAAAAATALCAAVIAPLRARLQRLVDRRLYPLRRAAQDGIDALQQRIHAGSAHPEELEGVLRSALRDPGLRVAYRTQADGYVDAAGLEVPTSGLGGAVPVLLGAEPVGLLTAERTTPALLHEVAASAGTLVGIGRLRLELAEAVREVEASRSRLVLAGNRERRRLERDLHDGAQQRLLSLGMTLRVAQRHLREGTVDVDGLFDQAVAELSTAVAELRQIAHGLRPSSLDDGFGAALQSLAQHGPVPVDVQVDGADSVDALSDEIATTAYYVACEALTNAVKHAGAERINVHAAFREGRVELRIHDDGRGGAVVTPGSGLAGLTDRVVAIGGSLSMLSPAGCGTTVEVMLPCAS